MKISIIYSTCSTKKKTKELGEELLKKKIIACFNIFPVEVGYHWLGNIESDHEWVIIIKTLPEKLEELEKLFHELHEYQVPAFIVIDATTSKVYYQWMKDSILV